MTKREAASHILAGAGALWPAGLCAIEALTRSPLEHALAGSICGDAASPATVLGHCPACLAGATALLLAAAMVRFTPALARRRT